MAPARVPRVGARELRPGVREEAKAPTAGTRVAAATGTRPMAAGAKAMALAKEVRALDLELNADVLVETLHAQARPRATSEAQRFHAPFWTSAAQGSTRVFGGQKSEAVFCPRRTDMRRIRASRSLHLRASKSLEWPTGTATRHAQVQLPLPLLQINVHICTYVYMCVWIYIYICV